MSSETWIAVLIAVAGYAAQFGATLAQLRHINRVLDKVLTNDLPHIQTRLNSLPCELHTKHIQAVLQLLNKHHKAVEDALSKDREVLAKAVAGLDRACTHLDHAIEREEQCQPKR